MVALVAAAGCGGSGGGDSGSAAPVAPAPQPIATVTTIDYPRSVVLGVTSLQDLAYVPANGATPATVTAAFPSTLLRAGSNIVVAERTEAALAGLRIVCVSGRGDSTNVITNINLGVIAESAAVLFDATWTAIDSSAAWTAAVGRGGSFVGWENCGVKPEGPPSASSRLSPTADGGYSEDVYDGNPGTTFNTSTRRVAPAAVLAMLSGSGFPTTEDPTRPLRLTLRAYRDASGNTVFVEVGEPVSGAPTATRGFVALYVRAAT